MFVCPIFHVLGMLGLGARERHQIWAGKASAVACIILCLIMAAAIVTGMVIAVAFPDLINDDDGDSDKNIVVWQH